MRKLMKLFAGFLSLIILISSFNSGYIVSAKPYSDKYYVGDEYFVYHTVDYEEPLEDYEYDPPSEYINHTSDLYISEFSFGFSRKFVVPDEIDGVEKKFVTIRNYEHLETVILSDGILTFECYNNQGFHHAEIDHWSWRRRKENDIKYLQLGKEFLYSGLYTSKYDYGKRMENLEKIYVSEENDELTSINGILYSKDLKTVIFVPDNSNNPDYRPKETTEIGPYAYAYTNNYKFISSKGIKKIGNNAFSDSKVDEVIINKKTTFVDNSAFARCKKLKEVTINGNTEKVFEKYAFSSCKRLKKVVINSKKIPEFKKYSFRGTKKGIRFYVKNKKLAKKLKKELVRTGVNNAKIYVGKKLIYTKK